ncbi:helix-turn-helix transcriptional regulator [Haladaptatus sp. ZSTT2]|uniref:helix-turn-helix transcriptional regulator n=1 Tax=Haladaptatus sp. ZSTT2 TaxID=3120515 RepID=UPI00300F07E0
MRSRVAAICALLVMLSVAVSGAVATSSGLGATALQAEPANEGVTMTIDLQPNGDARWEVSTEFSLDSENETKAFETLAAEFEDGNSDVGFSVDIFKRASKAASEHTGREMAIEGVARSHSVENQTGRLTLIFTWTNFATVSDDNYRVGDAFNTSSGTWLPELRADQQLVMLPPEAFAVSSAPIGFRNETLRWEGPVTFTAEDLEVTYRPADVDTQTPGPERNDFALVGLGVLALAVLALAVYMWYVRREDDPPAPTASANGGDSDLETVETTPDDEPATEPVEPDEDVDLDLLSDEERVERLLRAEGGRMKQATIVKETGWSNAKVSQLLSAMDEDGQIEKLRIGRENLISLPEQDTDAED